VATLEASSRLLVLAALSGCSLILDFSDKAGVHDAPTPDAFYTAAECAFDEPDDTFQTPATVTTSDTGPAAICPVSGTPDLDFYTFAVPDGTTAVSITVTYTDHGTSGDLDLSLFDASDTELASDDSFNTTKLIACPSTTPPLCAALAAGQYTFEVSGSEPTNANDYTFALVFDGSGSGSGSGM
jgi:Bacterial pre-peptidase C-terminal domain